MPKSVFESIDEEALKARLESEEAEAKIEHLPEVTIDDFSKVELVVGKVLESKKHPDADRLLVSQVDIGSGEVRQIVTGIAEFVKPEDLVGTKVIVVANLKPAKIKGVESKGMLLVGEDDELVNVLTSTCKVGTRIR